MKATRSPDSTIKFIRPQRWFAAALVIGFAGSDLVAQTTLELSLLRMNYGAMKRETRVNGAQADELRELEELAIAAQRRGENGPAFRDLSKAFALLQGKPWSSRDEFTHSLALATDATVCDPSHPLVVRIIQRFPASRDDELKFTLRASLEPFQGPGPGQPARRRGGKTKELGQFDELPPDLIFSPFRFSANLSDVSDGRYQLSVELRDGERLLHKLTSPLFVVHDFDTKHLALEQRLKNVTGFDGVKASVRYPFEFARAINLGRTEPGFFDFPAAMARSEELAADIESGKDPFDGKRGDVARHYDFTDAGEIMPYHVYVPKSYDGSKPVALIVALHGLGGTETSFLQGYGGVLPKVAEEHGFLVATPLGFRRNGGYGQLAGSTGPGGPASSRMFELSEMDVMNVLRLVREQYKVDENRIYLMGHSMGGGGTWKLGSKYADIWAALAPIAGSSPPSALLPLQKLKENHVPVICVHGDADRIVPVEGSRSLVAQLKRLGIEHEYIEVKGGTHGDVVASNIPRIVEFFSQHCRAAKTTTPDSASAKKLLLFGDPNPSNPAWQKALMEKSLQQVGGAFQSLGFDVDLIPTIELNPGIIKERLARYSRSLTQEDTFVMYSHSHGSNKGTYFANWRELADGILAIPARQVVVFTMSCDSGNLTDTLKRMKEKWEGRSSRGQSLVVLTPVGSNQKAGPSPEPGIGNPFTYAVSTAMEGAADGILGTGRNGRIEMKELVDYVMKTTRDKSRGQSYEPQFIGEYPVNEVFVGDKP